MKRSKQSKKQHSGDRGRDEAHVQKAKAAPAPKPVRKETFDSGLTRLQVGDIVDLGVGLGGEHLIWKCNDCRATCIPLTKRSVAFTRIGSGEDVAYNASLRPIGISPNSEVTILRRLGKTGMISFLENQNKQNESESEMSKEIKAKKKAAAADEPKLGRLGGFKGYAITAVIRAMAVAGWEYWECRAVFDAEKIPVADNTIRIQLSAGRAGKGGDPAPLSKKALAELRPDPDDKPQSARAAAKPAKGKKVKKAAKPAPDAEEDDEDDDEPAAKPVKKKSKPAPEPEEEEEEEADEPAADEDDE